MNDAFKEYGYEGSSSVQEAIEKFSVDLLVMMCGCPKRIVLDKHTYNRYMIEIMKGHTPETAQQVKDCKSFKLPTSSGMIEICCED